MDVDGSLPAHRLRGGWPRRPTSVWQAKGQRRSSRAGRAQGWHSVGAGGAGSTTGNSRKATVKARGRTVACGRCGSESVQRTRGNGERRASPGGVDLASADSGCLSWTTAVCLTNCLTTARHDNSIRRTLTDGVSVLAWGVLHVEAVPPLLHAVEVAGTSTACRRRSSTRGRSPATSSCRPARTSPSGRRVLDTYVFVRRVCQVSVTPQASAANSGQHL